MTRSSGRRAPRVLVAIVLLLAVGGLYGGLVTQLRDGIEDDERFVALERAGVAYLGPLTIFLSELTRAQSAAVRGGAIDTVALTATMTAVSDVDQRHAQALGTQPRWDDLRAAVERLAKLRLTGQAAMQEYADAVVLANALARKVGDTSKLILDPELDSYYLMDAALLQLPAVLIAAGLAADHAFLSENDAESDAEGRAVQDVEVAVARQQVAAAAESASAGIRKAQDATTRTELGANLTAPLDAFRAAAGELVPPVALRQSTDVATAAAAATAAKSVRERAVPLATAVLAELDALLVARQHGLVAQRWYGLGAAAAGVALAMILLWWSVPPRGRPSDDQAAAAGFDGDPATDLAALAAQLPLVDARDLLAVEELVHIGRGVRAHPKAAADDAQ